MRVVVVVPARLGSERLPRKVLADLGGAPLLQRVVERAAAAASVAEVLVATDSDEIAAVATGFGIRVVRTGAHTTGTDRVAEAARGLNAQVVVNVQGDQPFLDPTTVDAVVDRLGDLPMATACVPLRDVGSFLSPEVVKVVPDVRGLAVTFSRAPVPWPRGIALPVAGALPPQVGAWRHLGIYGFTAEALQAFSRLAPHPLERQEGLEQLRAVAHSWPIGLVEVASAGPAVDTPADLERARAMWGGASG